MLKMSSLLSKNQLLVTLVRHGETAHNAQRRMQGQTDSPLSETGKVQAEKLGKYEIHKFTRAYSSDLVRAHDTAQLILQFSKNPVEIKLDKRLRERCFGEAEGKLLSELLDEASKSGLSIIDYTPKGGESSKEVSIRAGSFFKELCELTDSLENPDGEHILVVAHGGWIGNLLRHLNSSQNFTLQNFDKAESYKISPNTGITRFSIAANKNGTSKHRVITFDVFNDASHLN